MCRARSKLENGVSDRKQAVSVSFHSMQTKSKFLILDIGHLFSKCKLPIHASFKQIYYAKRNNGITKLLTNLKQHYAQLQARFCPFLCWLRSVCYDGHLK